MGDRHAFRAKWHDYNGGLYFITICSFDKKHIFGKITDGTFYPSELGKLVTEHLQLIPQRHPDTELWNYVVMPNHVHLVLAVGMRLIASPPSPVSDITRLGCLKPPMHGDSVPDFHHNSRLANIIGTFKAGVSRTARTQLIASLPCWQSRFHEHIIRNQQSYNNIMTYIDNNIASWDNDCFFN